MNTIFSKKIPTLFGVILLLSGLGATTLLLQNTSSFESQASIYEKPQNIKITNITDSSISISFQTTKPLIGSISYGTTKSFGNIALDDLNQLTGASDPIQLHHITLSNLKADTIYYFSIISGEGTFLNDDKPFQFKTAPQITDISPFFPQFSGSITGIENPDDVVMYVTTESGQEVSTRVKRNKSYVISLANLRTKDLKSFVNFSPNDFILLTFISPTEKSTVKISIKQKSPIPIITLSQNYDFTLVLNK